MKTLRRSMVLILILATAILAAGIQQASAICILPLELIKLVRDNQPILLGTTGACNNEFPGGPCTETSTLVQINPSNGKLIKTIGRVGFTVNGLAWDRTSNKLYASTAIGCGLPGSACPFHGLITISLISGKGLPVNPNAVNFGLPGPDSPIHSIAVDPSGHMVGWYDEGPPPAIPPTGDTFVRINQKTGIATEFTDTGINTNQNGVSFSNTDFQLLWNIDSPRREEGSNGPTQFAFILNPFNGKPFFAVPVTPPTVAALGDFVPGTTTYYGLKFQGFDPTGATFIEVIDFDPVAEVGTATELGQTVDFLHTLTFIPHDCIH